MRWWGIRRRQKRRLLETSPSHRGHLVIDGCTYLTTLVRLPSVQTSSAAANERGGHTRDEILILCSTASPGLDLEVGYLSAAA